MTSASSNHVNAIDTSCLVRALTPANASACADHWAATGKSTCAATPRMVRSPGARKPGRTACHGRQELRARRTNPLPCPPEQAGDLLAGNASSSQSRACAVPPANVLTGHCDDGVRSLPVRRLMKHEHRACRAAAPPCSLRNFPELLPSQHVIVLLTHEPGGARRPHLRQPFPDPAGHFLREGEGGEGRQEQHEALRADTTQHC